MNFNSRNHTQQLSTIWESKYLYQVLGAKGEIGKSWSSNPLQTGEVILVGDGEKRLNGSLVSSRSCMSVVISGAEQLLFVYTMDCYNGLFRSCTN